MQLRRVLHAGCGNQPLPADFKADIEVRLDIEPRCNPDVVASLDNLGEIGQFGAVYSCHCLEHLHWDNAMQALREFHRVLVTGGIIVLLLPDIEGITPDDTVLYESAAGPVTGRDMIFGFQKYIAEFPHMAHKCGFTPALLKKALEDAGFSKVLVVKHGYDLVANGVKPDVLEAVPC